MSGTFDFTIEQGADLDLAFQCKDSQGAPVDLSGSTLAAFVRTTEVVLDLAPTFDDATLGKISVHVDAATTELLEGWGVGTWTLEVTNGSQVLRLLKGRVTLSERIDPWL
jgi:hypothetical protein